ncbi:MAG: J domain-containing protein [Planctomycetes bacterium]|nr:J domain-containing protein [Planctomycetota bacterium]
MTKIPQECDRYRRETPYDVLGVPPDATPKEIRNRYTCLTREVRESGLDVAERSKREKRLEEAYSQLRIAANRIKVDFFILDRSLGLKQCQAIAETLSEPDTEVADIIKPRRIRVTHDALLDCLDRLRREPEKVIGLHPQPIEIAETVSLPPPLAVQFDC